MQRTPKGDTTVPRVLSSLAARAWPLASGRLLDRLRHHRGLNFGRGAVLQVGLRTGDLGQRRIAALLENAPMLPRPSTSSEMVADSEAAALPVLQH
jgi:hypothetical protein